MGESGKYSLIHLDLGDLSKPANTLIKKISSAIGGLSKPFQIRRVAQAEADADKIQAAARIEITELEHRAMSRLFAEEAKKQQNIEAITLKALPDLRPDAQTERVEDDWIANFFDKCRLISDEQMQSLWARILAGEANSPGKFSKRTVNLVGSLDKLDATLLSQLCSFAFDIGGLTPLVFDHNHAIYNEAGINFGTLNHLESSGLIHLDILIEYARTGLRKNGFVKYFDSSVWLEFPQQPKDGNRLNIGHVILTKAGQELAPLSGAQPRAGFVDYVKEYWKRNGITTEPKITEPTILSPTGSDPAAK